MLTCPNCGSEVLPRERVCPDCGKDLVRTKPFSSQSSGPVPAIRKRYKDAYLVARATGGFGTLIKAIGVIVGALFVVVGLNFLNEGRGTQELGIVSVGLGFVLGALFFLLGILVSAQAQILKASLDAAVHTSPFLTNRDRAAIMSLPQGDAAEVRDSKATLSGKKMAIDDVNAVLDRINTS